MFCPVCSQEQASNDTRFCSRCGFLLIGVSQLIASGGALPQALQKTQTPKMSERKRGVKQGAALMLSGFVIVPILAIISATINAEPVLVAIMAVITMLGGLLRMIYALFFESKNIEAKDESILPEFIRKNMPADKHPRPLPPAGNMPNANYVPPTVNWRDTNDLSAPPPSVTDETTKLFKQ